MEEIGIFSEVTYRNISDSTTATYTIVPVRWEIKTIAGGIYDDIEIKHSKSDINPDLGIISCESPIGCALLGHKAGSKLSIPIPSGEIIKIEVLEVLNTRRKTENRCDEIIPIDERTLEYIKSQLEWAGDNPRHLKSILATVTAAYRKIGFPEMAIEIVDKYCEKYINDILSSQLLISVGAAHMDLNSKEAAYRCLKFSEQFDDADSNYLQSVWGRYHRLFGNNERWNKIET